MPPVIIPIAIAIGTAAVGVGISAVTVGAAIFSVAATAITAGVGYLLAEKPAAQKGADPTAAGANGFRDIPLRTATPPRRFVYGRCKTGGALFFQDNVNPHLYIGASLSDGEIDGVEGIYLGDTLVPVDVSGNAIPGNLYNARLSVEYGLGSPTQAASATLLAAFPTTLDATFRQQGVARAVAKLHWGTDAAQNSALWGSSLSPNYLIRGVKVYDPRDVTQNVATPATWKWSENPALCVAHFLISNWERPLPAAKIDWASVTTAANVCDGLLTYEGASVKRFTVSGVAESGVQLHQTLQAMLASMGGSIGYSGGLYTVNADAPRTSVWTITDDDIYEIGEFVHAAETDAIFDGIQADYFDASDAGTRNTTPVYEASAGGRTTTVSLLWSAASHSAQILAYRALWQARENRTLPLTVSDAGLWLAPHVDAVTVASTAAPFINGVYDVTQVDLMPAGAGLKLRQYSTTAQADPAGYLQ